MKKEYQIPREDVSKCLDFAKRFVLGGKSELDFGNTDLTRGQVDRIADCTEGKLGEIGATLLLQEYGIDAEIDSEIRQGRHNIDFGQDVTQLKTEGGNEVIVPRIDVKTTRSYSRWLLLETHKMWSSALLLFTVDLPRDTEENLGHFNKDITCRFKGFAYWFNFFDGNQQPWFLFKEGQKLIAVDAVERMHDRAKAAHGSVALRESLEEACKEIYGNSPPTVGLPLKCPKQMGLPDVFLRQSEEDMERFADIILASGIPQKNTGFTNNRN